MKRHLYKLGHWLMIGVILVGMLSACMTRQAAKDTIVIAVAEAKPEIEKDPNPHSLFAGALMAQNEINAKGGLNGHPVQVVPYADNGDVTQATANAQKILSTQAVAVIGNSSYETTVAVAPSYQSAGMPVVVASPMTEAVLSGHTNYFDIAYTSEKQGAYLANYASKVLRATSAMIIYEDETSNNALAIKFENTFRGLGGAIADIEKVSTALADNNDEKQAVVGKVFTYTSDSTILLLAVSDKSSLAIVKEIKNRGFASPILGGDNLGTRNFLETIKSEPAEQASPGFLTDNIITTRAFLPDSASGTTSQFVSDYQELYPGIPVSNSAARGYDAALAIFAALEKAESPSREAVLGGLSKLSNPATQLEGVTGPIFFKIDHKAVRRPLFGVYQHGYLISAPLQYQPVLLPENVPDLGAQQAVGHIIALDGSYVYVTHTIYTGMDLIELRDFDQKASTYTADFYLWFRYLPKKDDALFKPEEITFITATEPPKQDLVRSEQTSDGSVYSTYRVTGTFKNAFDFKAYPFDRQDLSMQFRNKSATASFIQYVVDRPGMNYENDTALLDNLKTNHVFNELVGWTARTAQAGQSLYSTTSTLGDPVNFGNTLATDFSLFEMLIQIKRSSLAFIVKSLLPLLFTLILAYISFFLPLGHSERLGVGSTALLTTAFFHLSLASSLPEIGYTVAMEYFFYASYLISAMIVFLETWSIRVQRDSDRESEKKENKDEAKIAHYEKVRQNLNLFGRIAYPAILLFVLALGGLASQNIIDLNPAAVTNPRAVDQLSTVRPTPSAATAAAVQPGNEQITLTLASWRPEDDAQIRELLQAFNDTHPGITVVHSPIQGATYDNNIILQLRNGGPDLFFAEPFLSRYVEFSADISVETDLKLNDNYPVRFLKPWQDANGHNYALPFVGVIQGIYYNKDVFDRLGLTVPETWEDFLKTADALEQAGYTPIGNSLVQNEENDIFWPLATSFIGGPTGRGRYDTGTRCFNDYYATRAFQAIADIAPYMSTNPDFKGMSSYTSKQLFIDQKAMMLFGGSWDARFFAENAKFNWGVFASPAPSGSKAYVIFQPDVGIAINKRVKAEDKRWQAAVEFLQWLTTPQALEITQEKLPGFYPLSQISLKPVDNNYSALFQQLTKKYQTDLRWAYSELSLSDQVPTAASLMQKAQWDIVANGLSPQAAAARLQTGLAEWYQPAQICKK